MIFVVFDIFIIIFLTKDHLKKVSNEKLV